jgi:colanic acid/amylovoran biosynthesis protein
MSNKYILINCYSDNNKGDSGIILSTVEMIKEFDNDAIIKGVSTYNFSDPAFHREHEYLKTFIEVLPSIFGELNIGKKKDVISKYLRLVFDIFRLIIFLVIPNLKFSKFLFSKEELKTLVELECADHVISKGGSFICNEKNIREKISLFRFMFIFLVCFKLNKKVTILCQSIGPVYGRFSTIFINFILKRCHKVVLREDVCVIDYPNLNLNYKNVLITNDIAFYLQSEDDFFGPLPLNENNVLTVGFTIKDVSNTVKCNYIKMMKESIEFVVENFNAQVFIFPHVTIDNDVEVSLDVYKELNDKVKMSVSVFSMDYNARQLKSMYSKLDLFIGTRLHSTIFAMGEFVPSICISYHGTKSQGIFKNYDMEDYAITEYNSSILINKIEKIIPELSNVKNKIRSYHGLFKKRHLEVFNEIFN